MCAEFKKKCISADNNSKINERFLWSENLTKLRMHQPVEDEITTIMETPIPEFEMIPMLEEDPAKIKINDIEIDIIETLSSQQMQELTEDISSLLTIDFHENEQFRFIERSARKSTRSITKILPDGSNQQFSCTKCALKFNDAQKLSLHFARIHIYRHKRNSL